MRFANRVPLLYQPKACAISEAIYDTNWRNYGLAQPKGSLPGRAARHRGAPGERVGAVHERGEGGGRALRRPLARDEAGACRSAGASSARTCARDEKAESEHKRLTLFQRYIPEVSAAIGSILGTAQGPGRERLRPCAPQLRADGREGGHEEPPPSPPPRPSIPPGELLEGERNTIPPLPPVFAVPPMPRRLPGSPGKAARAPKRKSVQLDLIQD